MEAETVYIDAPVDTSLTERFQKNESYRTPLIHIDLSKLFNNTNMMDSRLEQRIKLVKHVEKSSENVTKQI